MAISIKKNLLTMVMHVLSRIWSQQVWEGLFHLSLRQMNVGNGADHDRSGELFVARLIQHELRDEASITIFDVGANNGAYTKAVSSIFGERASIHSFEPSLRTYDALLETTHGLENVTPHNFGFGDNERTQLLFTNADGSGLASVYQRKLDHFGIAMDRTEEIKLTTIDAFCDKHKIDRIHFLKLDIEGNELNALKGAQQMMRSGNIDYIQFEFGGCNIDSRTYFQDFYYLLKDHYDLYRILKNGIHGLGKYKETYELFITVNYLAIMRPVEAVPARPLPELAALAKH